MDLLHTIFRLLGLLLGVCAVVVMAAIMRDPPPGSTVWWLNWISEALALAGTLIVALMDARMAAWIAILKQEQGAERPVEPLPPED